MKASQGQGEKKGTSFTKHITRQVSKLQSEGLTCTYDNEALTNFSWEMGKPNNHENSQNSLWVCF